MPVDTRAIAQHVADTMPYIQQVFVDITGVKEVEKRLFLARKQIEKYSETQSIDLYFTSLSHRTIVYKGWLRSDQIKGLYLDLQNEAYQSKLGLVHSALVLIHFQVGNVHIPIACLCTMVKLIPLRVT